MEPLSALKEYWPLIVLGTNGLVMWGVWSFRKATVSREDFVAFTNSINQTIKQNDDEIKDRLSAQDRRITAVESELKHMPDHDDLKRIHSRLDGFGETLSEVKGATSASINQLELIHEHLLSQKGKH
ncbi:MAG: hypothetical protein CMI09_03345 [Oceanospirillaceae bacterium]|nr:hypothetical protein [Oceanospirillaceae bacterium]|tara:strand:+ start:624 stop:1004 length:381 start_codon:yes stop_codon:yes gene_type:complete